MKKDDLVYVGHMLDMARSIMQKTSGVTQPVFNADENLQLALTHLIQIIGEAAARVSAEFRELHSDISWKQIVGMRHKIVHDYLHVDFELVWEVASHDIPTLVRQLEPVVPG